MYTFVIEVRTESGSLVLPKTALVVDLNKVTTFETLFSVLKDTVGDRLPQAIDSVTKVRVFQDLQKRVEGIEVPGVATDTQVSVDLQFRGVEFSVYSGLGSCDTDSNHGNSVTGQTEAGKTKRDAFALLMSTSVEYMLPPKHDHDCGTQMDRKLTGPQQLYNDLIDWLNSINAGWTKACMDSAKAVVNALTNSLWYIDHCHDKLQEKCCKLPSAFDKFQGYNRYKELRHKAPVVTSEKLESICCDLAKCLSFPSMQTKRNSRLYTEGEALLNSLSKYKAHLDRDAVNHREKYHACTEGKCVGEKDSSLQFIPPIPAVPSCYAVLNDTFNRCNDFEYISIDEFCPHDRIERRKYIKDLRLSKPLMLFRIAYGGSIGTLNFVWPVPWDDSPERSTRNSLVIGNITQTVPKFSSRAMRRDFLDKYASYVKASKSVMRQMFYDLTGCEPASENKEQKTRDETTAKVLMNSDDPDLLLDWRALNRKDVDTKFGQFFDEVGKFFEEQLLAVQERRHGEALYLPLAMSIEDLSAQVAKRLPPETPIPSNETLRLQFLPSTEFAKTALRHTGRFQVKFRVQTRQARMDHPDSKYVAVQFRYLKEFCVRFRDQAVFACLDDKSIVPVGEPGAAISTGVRGHNKVLAPVDGPTLTALDHDFHVCGLVPSVVLLCDIPQDKADSFFRGTICVTTKDKIFQPSTPYRHATELVAVLRHLCSTDSVNLSKPILAIMTDGGPDHRLTYETVKASLVQLFMQLDLDMLVATRTAPNHSWLNPAERCMSILNLALQHAALERDQLPEHLEKHLKNKSSMAAIREVALHNAHLKEAYAEAVINVIELVNKRFQRMKLKGKHIKTYEAALDADIESQLDPVRTFTSSHLSTSSKTDDIRKMKPLQVMNLLSKKKMDFFFMKKANMYF